MKLSELSLADLIQLYRWYESRYSEDDGKIISQQFKKIGDEIRSRISEIEFQLS